MHAMWITRRVRLMREYVVACEAGDIRPLPSLMALAARQIREYRITFKYFDCF